MEEKSRKLMTFYQSVDQQFYAEIRKNNGGKLPVDLVGPDGQPRALTCNAKDVEYLKLWSRIVDEKRNSKAIQKTLGCQAG